MILRLLPILALPSILAGCAAPDRHRQPRLAPDEWAWCLNPDGTVRAWDYSAGLVDADGQPLGTCPAPGWFVRVPACGEGQASHDETAEVQAARARFGRDGSLHGDHFAGLWFCAPRPPS